MTSATTKAREPVSPGAGGRSVNNALRAAHESRQQVYGLLPINARNGRRSSGAASHATEDQRRRTPHLGTVGLQVKLIVAAQAQ